MRNEIAAAVKTIAGRITAEVKSDDAMRYGQAILNLAHAHAQFVQADKSTITTITGDGLGPLSGVDLDPHIAGVRVDGDKVVIACKGGNAAARMLCEMILEGR